MSETYLQELVQCQKAVDVDLTCRRINFDARYPHFSSPKDTSVRASFDCKHYHFTILIHTAL